MTVDHQSGDAPDIANLQEKLGNLEAMHRVTSGQIPPDTQVMIDSGESAQSEKPALMRKEEHIVAHVTSIEEN